MKLKALSFVLPLLLCAFSNSYAQVSEGGQPYTFTHQVSASIEIKAMSGIDTEALLREDESAPEDEPYRFGYGFDVSYNLQNSGGWNRLPDGGNLWLLKIISQGAYSINLIYGKFWLPEGAKFFIYNNDKSMVIGAFTSRNNKPHGKFATGLVKGDEIILEYYEPANTTQAGEISISRIVHAYRDFFNDPKTGEIYYRQLIAEYPDDDLSISALATLGEWKPEEPKPEQQLLTVNPAPAEFSLDQNYPNPFNPETTIRYHIAEASHVTIKIYNLLGEEVISLVDHSQLQGNHAIQWNGRDRFGNVVTNGVYWLRMQAGKFVGQKKLILLR